MLPAVELVFPLSVPSRSAGGSALVDESDSSCTGAGRLIGLNVPSHLTRCEEQALARSSTHKILNIFTIPPNEYFIYLF